MKLKLKKGLCETYYVDVDSADKFDHNLLICNGCFYWYNIYNRCTYHRSGNEYFERMDCEIAQRKGECPHKHYIRYYDKNYKFFLKNKKDELYLRLKRKREKK